MKASIICSLLAVGITVISSGCAIHSADAGHEVVLTAKPLFFGHGGVIDTPVKTGTSVTALTTHGTDVNMQPQKFEAEMPDTMTSDGVPLSFHAVAVLQVTDSIKLIQNFGEEWYKNNLNIPFQNAIRQAVRKHGLNETAISTEALDSIDAEIKVELAKAISAANLPVHMLSVTVGKANPPDAIKNQRIETAAQQQRIQTEKQKKLAEDMRLAAEQSRANADNAYRESMHLSPEQFIQLETIKMQQAVCGEGKTQCTFIQNGTPAVYNLNR